MSLSKTMAGMGRAARDAARVLAEATAEQRSAAITSAAAALERDVALITAANARDVEAAEAAGLEAPLIDRLRLNAEGVRAIAAGLRTIAAIPDPLGEEMACWTRPNGLVIRRVRTPIGVLAVIYESRPNVTADAAALCIRSGNAVILRCGSEALETSRAIHAAIVAGLADAGLPAAAVQIVPTRDREAVGLILSGLDGMIDLIVPRGGRSLVERVAKEARAPVLGHLEGLCHTYVHAAAALEKATAIVLNAKLRRVSVCGATETLLFDRAGAERLLPPIAQALAEAKCELRGDEHARTLFRGMIAATEADWTTEYLAPILAVRVVEDLDGAIDHIRRHGSGHTDAIVTEDADAAETFLRRVDSAIVLHNASTQFADGGEFGFGGEIGISTSKLHARGPVGAEQLTTFKYVVLGAGQVRP